MTGDTERWRRLDEAFAAAWDAPTAERPAVIAAACGDDRSLRDEVSSMVELARGAGERLQDAITTTAAGLASAIDERRIGGMLGPYRIREVLGEGGMGTVYLAERDDAQYTRRVAIKVLQHGLASPQVIARFRDERQILASLDHPAIVRLIDGGSTEDGLPYLVMDYIEGFPLTRYAAGRTVRARIELVLQVCRAVEYAHGRLVVHRDLKPGNILVTPDGSVRLLDFGIAKLIQPDLGVGREGATRTGMALLTPEYASPEQARGDVITVATDVYSLGAVLYELLVGTPPHRAADDLIATLRAICEVEPPRPSLAAPASSRRSLAGDLDNIVMRALQKEPSRRYASVAALRDDLERFLDGRPVAARDATIAYRARKFIRRHRLGLAIGSIVALALTSATVTSIVLARRATRAVEATQRETRTLLYEQGHRNLADGHPDRALPYLVEALAIGGPEAPLRFLITEAKRPFLRVDKRIDDFPGGVAEVAWSPSGDSFIVVGFEGHAALYDASGARVRELETSTTAALSRVQFEPSGKEVSAATRDGRILIWQLDGDEGARTMEVQPGEYWNHSFDDRATLWTYSTDGDRDQREHVARLRDPETGAMIREIALPEGTTSVAVAVRGTRLFAMTPRGVYGLDQTTGARVFSPASGSDRPIDLVTSSDGARFYVWTADAGISIRDGATGVELAHVPVSGAPRGLDLSPDERRLLFATEAGIAAIVDATTGAIQHYLGDPGEGTLESAHFTPDGRMVVITEDATFRVYDAVDGRLLLEEERSAPATAGALDARISPDGLHVLSLVGGAVILWRVPRLLDVNGRGDDFFQDGTWTTAEDGLLIVGRGGLARRYALAEGAVSEPLEAPEVALSSVDAQDDALAMAGTNGVAIVIGPGGVRRSLVGHDGKVNAIRLRPGGGAVITCGNDRTARIWDVETGAPIRTLDHAERVMSAAWSRDGKQVATAGWNGLIRVWDADRGALLAEVGDRSTPYLAVGFTPDERGVVVAGDDGLVTAWSLDGHRAQDFEGHGEPVVWVEYSPDGALLATASRDGTLRIWDPATGKELGQRTQVGEVVAARWDLAGARLVGFSTKQAVVWDVGRDDGSVQQLRRFVEDNVPFALAEGRLVRR